MPEPLLVTKMTGVCPPHERFFRIFSRHPSSRVCGLRLPLCQGGVIAARIRTERNTIMIRTSILSMAFLVLMGTTATPAEEPKQAEDKVVSASTRSHA